MMVVWRCKLEHLDFESARALPTASEFNHHTLCSRLRVDCDCGMGPIGCGMGKGWLVSIASLFISIWKNISRPFSGPSKEDGKNLEMD